MTFKTQNLATILAEGGGKTFFSTQMTFTTRIWQQFWPRGGGNFFWEHSNDFYNKNLAMILAKGGGTIWLGVHKWLLQPEFGNDSGEGWGNFFEDISSITFFYLIPLFMKLDNGQEVLKRGLACLGLIEFPPEIRKQCLENFPLPLAGIIAKFWW